MLCPFDRAHSTAMKYLSLFLPTSSHIPPEHTYELWLDEFLTLWRSFSNRPHWEIHLFGLFSRLAFHNVGRIEWAPHFDAIFTQIMISLNIPVTFAHSGIKISYGLASAGNMTAVARWIVSAMEGGRGLVQKYLDKIFLAIESYYHPANSGNSATETLHGFVSLLTNYYVNRLHNERYNRKWPPRVPPEKRLTDADVDAFVRSIKPIAMHVMYNPFDDAKKVMFNVLATLRPQMILPTLFDRLQSASESLTEPHRFTACISTLSACSRSLVENYPSQAVDILLMLLPGIDLNDVWKTAENFILMSDLLEMIYLVDFSNPNSWAPGADPTEEERATLAKTAQFEDFAIELTDKILTLVENSSRMETRGTENEPMDEQLNDEEIAVDAGIADTFHKMIFKASPEIFNRVFAKLRDYVRDRILEPAVAGNILAGMCKSAVCVQPESSLKFFVPHLTQRVLNALKERVDVKKADAELHYSLLLLSEVASVRSTNFFVTGCPLLPYLDKICTVLDKTLTLKNRDEYETAQSLLCNCLYSLGHIRPLTEDVAKTHKQWSREVFRWGKAGDLETLDLKWYVPDEEELAAAQKLIDRYLLPLHDELAGMASGEVELPPKEEMVQRLRMLYR